MTAADKHASEAGYLLNRAEDRIYGDGSGSLQGVLQGIGSAVEALAHATLSLRPDVTFGGTDSIDGRAYVDAAEKAERRVAGLTEEINTRGHAIRSLKAEADGFRNDVREAEAAHDDLAKLFGALSVRVAKAIEILDMESEGGVLAHDEARILALATLRPTRVGERIG